MIPHKTPWARAALVVGLFLFLDFFPLFAKAEDMEDLGVSGSYSAGYSIANDGTIVGQVEDNLGDFFGFSEKNGAITLINFAGYNHTFIGDISADGLVIVGYGGATTNYTDYHAIKSVNGVETDLGTLGGSHATARAVSNDGSIIVGTSSITGDTSSHAFKYQYGVMTDLGNLSGGIASSAIDISGNGLVIVGYADVVGGDRHAFKYEGGVMSDLGTLGGLNNSFAYGVSNNGSVIVGESLNNFTDIHAFKYEGGIMSDIGNLGGSTASAYGVSGNGLVIVGESKIAGDAANHAFKYVNGTMTDLGTLGGSNSAAYGASYDGSVIMGESRIAGDAETHAFVLRTVGYSNPSLVDVNNTIAVLAKNASQLNSIFNLSSSLLSGTLDQDAKLFGKNGIHLSLGTRYSGIKSSDAKNNSAQLGGTLKVAYRFNQNFRAGIFIDQSLANNLPNNFALQKQMPMMGIFAVLSENSDDRGASLRLAAAYNSNDISIARSVLSNTEAGRGKTSFVSKGALAELAYAFEISKKVKLQPYTGLRFLQITRDSYSENSGADFPITFKKAEKKSTSGLLGMRLNLALSAKFETRFGLGFERDFSNSLDGYAGNISSLGSFNLTPNNIRRNRAFGSVGMSYKIADFQTVGFDVFYSKQSLSAANGLTAYLQYSLGF